MAEHEHDWFIWSMEDGHAEVICSECNQELPGFDAEVRLNAYDALVAACEAALAEITCKCDPVWTERGRHEPNDTCYLEPELRAALAKAKGES